MNGAQRLLLQIGLFAICAKANWPQSLQSIIWHQDSLVADQDQVSVLWNSGDDDTGVAWAVEFVQHSANVERSRYFGTNDWSSTERSLILHQEDTMSDQPCLWQGQCRVLMKKTPSVLNVLRQRKPDIRTEIFLLDAVGHDVKVTEIYFIDDEEIENLVERWYESERVFQAGPIWTRRQDLHQKRFNIGIVEYKPYAFFPQGEVTDAYGFDIEVLRHLATNLNFSYTLQAPKDGSFGKRLDNGTWTGLSGLIQDGSVDFSASLFFNTLDRSSVMEFSAAVEATQPMVVMHRVDLAMINPYLAVFSTSTWILLCCSVIGVWACACFIALVKSDQVPKDLTLATLGGCVCQGASIALEKPCVKVLFFTAVVFGFVIFATFGALLTSYLSVSKNTNVYDTLEDIDKANLDVFVLGGTSYEGIFSQAKPDTPGRSIWDKKLKDSVLFRDTNYALLSSRFANQGNQGKSVFLSNAKTFSYWRSVNQKIGCQLTSKSARFGKFLNSLGFQVGSPYKWLFDHQIRVARESGLLSLWAQDWLDSLDQSEAYVCSAAELQVPDGLDFGVALLPFGVVMAGAVVAFGLVVFELVCRSRFLK